MFCQRGNVCQEMKVDCTSFELAQDGAGRCQAEGDKLIFNGGTPTLNMRYSVIKVNETLDCFIFLLTSQVLRKSTGT